MFKFIVLFAVSLVSSVCSFVAVREFVAFRDPVPLLAILSIIFILAVTRIIPSSGRPDKRITE